MNNLQTLTALASLTLVSAVPAQGQATPAQPATQASSPVSATPSQDDTSGKVVPGKTPTQGAPSDTEAVTSSSATEATAPDGTAARETPAVEPGTSSGTAAAKIVGRPVVTSNYVPLGKVAEVVFDSKGQPAFVVISAQGRSSAMPYETATSMLSGDKVIVDKTRLQGAPRLKAGEWRDQSSTEWKSEASRYWNRS